MNNAPNDTFDTVSVILTTYNRPNFLPEAIESVLNQSYRELELIIVDDGSSNPEIATICQRYAATDNRVKYIWQNNAGLSAARNRGVRESAAEFIIFTDDDDIMLPNRVEKQLEFMRKYPHVAGIACQLTYINTAGQAIQENLPIQPQLITTIPSTWDELLKQHEKLMLGGPLTCYRRNIYVDLGGFDEKLWCIEDVEFSLRIGGKFPIARMEECLHLHRVHEGARLTTHPQAWHYHCVAIACAYFRYNSMTIPDDILSTEMFQDGDIIKIFGERRVKTFSRLVRSSAKKLMRAGELIPLQKLLDAFNKVHCAPHYRQFRIALYWRMLIWAIYYGKLKALPVIIKTGIKPPPR